MISSMFWLGGFGIFHMIIIGYFGQVFDFAYETRKNSHMYIFSLESLVSLSSYTVLNYDCTPHVY